MSTSGLIDNIIGLTVKSGDTVQEEYDDDGLVDVGDDAVTELKTTIMSMKLVIEGLDKKVTRLELEVDRLKMNENNDRPRTSAAMPLPYAMKHTNSPSFGRKGSIADNDDTESFASLGRARSDISAPAGPARPPTYSTRVLNPAVFSSSSPLMSKSTSAISSRGYDNKLSLWGTVFASLMIACMKKYIQRTGETGHIVDECMLMKTYSRIVGDLYHRMKFSDLPAVQSHEVALLSKVFSRTNKNDVPESTPQTWIDMRANTDGNACVSVIESIVTAAKMVPEAMMHPISRLIAAMDQPVVVNTSKGPTFAIPTDTRIEMTPTGIERFCSWLKKESLRTYVKHRLNGDNEIAAVTKMIATMKDTELFDSKNLYKGRELIGTMARDGVD